jgi:Domain of unknown function (DUF4388)
MADTFPLSGNIDPTTFPFLLVDLYRRGATGSLKVEGPTHPKALYFRGGRVLFGSSNDPKDQLGAILIENGKITQEQLDDVNTKVGPGNPLAKVLAESGYVNQRELGEAARIKVERILSDLIAYETGTFEFEDGVLPKGAVDLKLSTEKLLLAAVSRITDRAFALRHLESLGVVLAAVPDWDAQLSEIRSEAGTLLERLDGQRSLKDAVALTRFDEFDGAKLACGLLFLGLAKKMDPAAAAVASGPAGDELDLGESAAAPFAGGETDGAPTLDGSEDEAPFFTQGSTFVEPTQSPELPDVPFNEPNRAAFGAEEAESPPIEGLLADASAPALPPMEPPTAAEEPSAFAISAPSEPEGFSFNPGAELNPGPELAFEPPPAEPPPPSPVPVPPPPTTAELPALGANDSQTNPGFRMPASIPSPSPPRGAEIQIGASAPARHDVEDAVTVPPSRPSKEDLAALDALLNPSGTNPGTDSGAAHPQSASLNPSASMRMRSTVPRPPLQEKRWEPQFRPPSGSSSGIRRGRAPRRPILPLAIAALVILGVSAAGYYFLFVRAPGKEVASNPRPAPVAPTTLRAATPAPPVSTAPSPVPSPSLAASVAPATPPPATPVAVAPPATAPPATAPPATTAPAPVAADARGRLRRGEFAEAARDFTSEVRKAGSRYSVQVLVACSGETVQKALDNVPSSELFILPVNYHGKACYRICWGLYESQDRATAALLSLPEYFRQGGASPKVSPAAALLP